MFHSHMRPAATMDSCIIPENISENSLRPEKLCNTIQFLDCRCILDCKIVLTIHGPGKIVIIEK